MPAKGPVLGAHSVQRGAGRPAQNGWKRNAVAICARAAVVRVIKGRGMIVEVDGGANVVPGRHHLLCSVADRLGPPTVAAKLRPDAVRAVADMWNNGYPGGARPSAFTGPVLLLRGGSDETVTHELLASAVAARFGPEATVSEIDGAHHWSHLERPAAVAAEIDRFLASTTAATGVASVASAA